ncbi:MAG: hypothetical protein LIO53_02960 [Oscillospiraceae bacterium]|nr:hypothetical protein [Oscillospiraceae bacterium]
MGGLGYSENGGRSYVTAITSDGSIVADRITTGKLTTITIEAANGNSYWNLDDGDFVIKKGTISLGAFKNCPSCGGSVEMKLNDDGDMFICPDCGYEVSIDEASYHFSVDDTGTVYAELGKIGGFEITSDSIYNDAMTLDDSGLWWKYVTSDNSRYNIGAFSTTHWETDSSVLGVDMNLSYSKKARYISWGYQASDGGVYEMKLMYATKDFSDYDGDMLHLGCPIDGHKHVCERFFINPETGGANNGLDSGTTKIYLPTEVSNDGSISAYATVYVKGGFIVVKE